MAAIFLCRLGANEFDAWYGGRLLFADSDWR